MAQVLNSGTPLASLVNYMLGSRPVDASVGAVLGFVNGFGGGRVFRGTSQKEQFVVQKAICQQDRSLEFLLFASLLIILGVIWCRRAVRVSTGTAVILSGRHGRRA